MTLKRKRTDVVVVKKIEFKGIEGQNKGNLVMHFNILKYS